MHTAVYVYCLVRRARTPQAADAPAGLPGAGAPEVHPIDPGTWVVSAVVPLAVYGPEPLEEALRDLDRVGRIGLAHDRVVAHFLKQRGSTVVPMTLFTMFSTVARALADLRRRRRQITSAFDRIEGCEEWGVRVLTGAAQSSRRGRTDAATGAAFLAARKQARDESRARTEGATAAADAAYDSLAAYARERRRREALMAGARPPLLDAAFLVPTRRRAAFQAAVRKAAREVARAGAELTLTGPWPAYSFVGPEERA